MAIANANQKCHANEYNRIDRTIIEQKLAFNQAF